MPRRINSTDWVSYGRAFLMTLGLIILTLPILIWNKQGERSSEWPQFAWVLLYGFIIFGIILLFVAVTASPKTINKWAGAASTHEAGLVVMIIAAPVYFLLKLLNGKR